MDKIIAGILDNKYSVIRPIGAGGMGRTYLVEDIDKKLYCAKLISYDNKQQLEEIIREGELLIRLNNPLIVKGKEILYTNKYVVIIMEYAYGDTLYNIIDNKWNKGMPYSLAIKLFMQLLDVISYLHKQNPIIIYRDLKPNNIIINNDNIKLIDMGIAIEAQNYDSTMTVRLGTPGYAAPEQYVDAGSVDEKTDIYSLGAVLYYMLSGKDLSKPPYQLEELASKSGKIPYYIDELVRHCMDKNPNNRFNNIEEILYFINKYKYSKKISRLNHINIMIVHGEI